MIRSYHVFLMVSMFTVLGFNVLFAADTDRSHFIDITIQEQSIMYRSADHLLVEQMKEGRWVCRYRSADDRFPIASEDQSTKNETFFLKIGEKILSDGWQLVSLKRYAPQKEGCQGTVVHLSNNEEAIDVLIYTLLDGTAIYTRWLEITNKGDKAIPMTEVAPWSGVLWPQRGWSLDFADYEVGYFQRNTTFCPMGWAHEGWFTWEPLGKSKKKITTSHKMRDHNDPFFILRNNFTGEYCIANLQWTTNWKLEFEFVDEGLSFKVGPCVKQWSNQILRVIAPGETIQTPALHLGLVSGNLDDAVQHMHTHIRKTVLPSRIKDRSGLVQYLVPSDQSFSMPFTEADIFKQVDIAVEIGAELFILDYGWWDIVLDWQASPTRFPGGIKPIADHVHSKGLLFGMYVEAEGGRGDKLASSRVAREHPDWITTSGVLNLSIPQAAEWMESEICRLVETYDLDLYRLDYNPGLQGDYYFQTTERSGFLENDGWRYYDAFYDIYRRIKEKYPDLLLQQAAAGGGRNDLGVVSFFDETYLTDGLWVPQEFLVYSGLTMSLPPEILTTLHGGAPREFFGQRLDAVVRMTFTTGTPQIFTGMAAPSLDQMQPKRLETFKRYCKLYKEFIRPLLPICKVYHHEPINASGGISSSDYFAMEFASPTKNKGWALFMKTNQHIQNQKLVATNVADDYIFKPRGLDSGRNYKVTFDSLDTSVEITGAQMLTHGLPVRLEDVGSSELILFEAD